MGPRYALCVYFSVQQPSRGRPRGGGRITVSSEGAASPSPCPPPPPHPNASILLLLAQGFRCPVGKLHVSPGEARQEMPVQGAGAAPAACVLLSSCSGGDVSWRGSSEVSTFPKTGLEAWRAGGTVSPLGTQVVTEALQLGICEEQQTPAW